MTTLTQSPSQQIVQDDVAHLLNPPPLEALQPTETSQPEFPKSPTRGDDDNFTAQGFDASQSPPQRSASLPMDTDNNNVSTNTQSGSEYARWHSSISQPRPAPSLTSEHPTIFTSHRKLIAGLVERDRKIATLGTEIALLKSKVRNADAAREDMEKEQDRVKHENMNLRSEIDSMRLKVCSMQAVVDRLSFENEKKEQALQQEKSLRKQADAAAKNSETRRAEEATSVQVQLRHMQEQPRKFHYDLQRLKDKLAEQEHNATMLKRENFRLTNILKSHGISSVPGSEAHPPEYTRLIREGRFKEIPKTVKKLGTSSTVGVGSNVSSQMGSRSITPNPMMHAVNLIKPRGNTAARSKSPMGVATSLSYMSTAVSGQAAAGSSILLTHTKIAAVGDAPDSVPSADIIQSHYETTTTTTSQLHVMPTHHPRRSPSTMAGNISSSSSSGNYNNTITNNNNNTQVTKQTAASGRVPLPPCTITELRNVNKVESTVPTTGVEQ